MSTSSSILRTRRGFRVPTAGLAAVVMSLIGALGIVAVGIAAGSAPQIGRPAPDFTATDSKGSSLSLSQFRGKTVVLEWTNADCPYTRKHYTSGNMQSIQALAQKNGVVWLSVISSAPGKQGYVNGPAADALTQSRGAFPTAVLLDPSGTLGRLYGAKTTPHMFVIDKEGKIQHIEEDSRPHSATFFPVPRACVIDQNPSHGLRRRRVKMSLPRPRNLTWPH